ncbi:MAG TPA: cytochrome c oxidase subunit II [Vicinamibacterales bacterium]|nr:cytochrome c oxidase subunit II [Vicinamibacterales bacterium]
MRRTLRCLAAAVLAGGSAGCQGSENMLAPAGPAAGRIAALGWFVLVVFIVVTVVMWALIFWAAARRRGTLLEHLPWDAPGDRRWIVIGGFTIPVIVLSTIFVVMLRSMAAFPMGDGEMSLKPADVHVTGHQWWWEIEYTEGGVDGHVVTANELHIPTGRPVDIELRAHDVIHSFWVPRLHGKVDLVPGLVNRIRIQADRAGVYPGQCAEYCGPQHAHMMLAVKAEAPDDFEAWLARLRAPAAPPASDDARLGQRLFMNSQCALCHTIRGTGARGLVGPDLTHVGSRMGLAANALPNNRATLSAWVTHAQSLKPYAQMPNVTAFRGDELQQLVAYLQGLK